MRATGAPAPPAWRNAVRERPATACVAGERISTSKTASGLAAELAGGDLAPQRIPIVLTSPTPESLVTRR